MTNEYSSKAERILVQSGLIYKVETNIDGDHYYPEIVKDKDFNDRVEQALKQLTDLITQAQIEARLGMIEYYDQAPTNESCNWKGLLADNRKQLEYELQSTLKKEQ